MAGIATRMAERKNSQTTRRTVLKAGLTTLDAGATVGVLGLSGVPAKGRKGRKGKKRRKGGSTVLSGHKPFSRPLPKPPVLKATTLDPEPGSENAQVGSNAVNHGMAPEYFRDHPVHATANENEPLEERWDRFSEVHYQLDIKEGVHQFIEGVDTPIFGYGRIFPGPTILAQQGEPVVVRTSNYLDVECSLHLHGDHTPAHSDGYPDFYILQGKTRDYYYLNIGPRLHASPEKGGNSGPYELSALPMTMWYHDHGMDITGFTVSRGLAGFYLVQDDHEMELINENILPELYGDYDIPMALMDQQVDNNGNLPYDFLDHNGRLGSTNIQTVNGVLQPYVHVERRKYHFRFLNASNARIYHLRLSSGQPFLKIGQDTWEIETAHTLPEFTVSMAQRFDVIVDFSDAPDELFLENVMQQDSGRKPDGVDRSKPTQLVKFIVDSKKVNKNEDLAVEAGTTIRPFTPILEEEIVATRKFVFERRNGA